MSHSQVGIRRPPSYWAKQLPRTMANKERQKRWVRVKRDVD